MPEPLTDAPEPTGMLAAADPPPDSSDDPQTPPDTSVPAVRYLTYSELIFINGRILQNPALQNGQQKIRDIDLLMAAELRPQASAFGVDAYTDLRHKAAAQFHSIARNHPFADGNKRTATVALLFFCEVNGWSLSWDAQDALTTILDAAEGRLDWPALADWLDMTRLDTGVQPVDQQRDIHHIDRIIHQHRHLLHELERR